MLDHEVLPIYYSLNLNLKSKLLYKTLSNPKFPIHNPQSTVSVKMVNKDIPKRKWADMRESSPIRQLKKFKHTDGDDEEPLPEPKVKVETSIKPEPEEECQGVDVDMKDEDIEQKAQPQGAMKEERDLQARDNVQERLKIELAPEWETMVQDSIDNVQALREELLKETRQGQDHFRKPQECYQKVQEKHDASVKVIRTILKAYKCDTNLLVNDEEYLKKFQDMLTSRGSGYTIRRTKTGVRIERI